MLCGGATQPRDLPVEGRDLKGIHFAVDFLRADTRSLLGAELGADEWISARHKDVVVIGGGDTGTDCVGTSLRHGCSSIVQLEIMPRPPDTRPADNPWPEWPRTFRTDYGQEEAREIFGRDPREFAILTKRFVGDAAGRVQEVHTVRVEWGQTDGRPSFRELPGTEQRWPAHLVLLAMGFLGPESTLIEQFGLEQDAANVLRTKCARVWAIRHPCPRRLRGRRHAPRAEPGGVGHQRGPRRGARVRSLPDGVDAFALKWSADDLPELPGSSGFREVPEGRRRAAPHPAALICLPGRAYCDPASDTESMISQMLSSQSRCSGFIRHERKQVICS